uniref:K Homology domain-containing protein n=1 Tax=Panagrolaimus sp. JU765 TaxID=591449 RepID=A0AC34RCB9_9BILA
MNGPASGDERVLSGLNSSALFSKDKINIASNLDEKSVDLLFNDLYRCVDSLTAFELSLGLRFVHSRQILQDAMTQLQERYSDLTAGHNPTAEEKIYFPSSSDAKNHVGKIVGPRGSSIRRLEETYRCFVRVRGKGSVKDAKIEAQLRGVAGYEHLNDDLHIRVEAVGMGAKVRVRACTEAIYKMIFDDGTSRDGNGTRTNVYRGVNHNRFEV